MYRLAAAVVTMCSVQSACTSQMASLPHVKTYVDEQDFKSALDEIERIDKGTSRLLYLYQKGLVLHYSGRYDESNTALEEAEHLFDDLYTKSLSRELGALLTSDNIIKYRGERYEAAMIHYYKILNYLLVSKPDGALVECRKLNNRLLAFSDAADSVYVNDPFLQYLTGMVYLDAGEVSDADVSLRVALDAYASLGERYGVEIPPSLHCDLARCAALLGDREATARYLEAGDRCDESGTAENSGELNVFLECGYVPYKIEQNIVLPIYKGEAGEDVDSDEIAATVARRYGEPIQKNRELDYLLRVALPELVSSPQPFWGAEIRVTVEGRAYRAPAEVVENLDALAFEAFESHRNGVLLKTVSRALAKYLAKEGADDRSFLAGWIVNLFNVATESADVRSWATLPQTIRMARLALPEGCYDLEIILHNGTAGDDESYMVHDVDVRPGRSTFLNLRVN